MSGGNKKPSLRGRLENHVGKIVTGVLVTVIGALVLTWLGLGSDKGSEEESSSRNRSNVQYTVQNDADEGVWSLTSPVMVEFLSRDERPRNGAHWVENTSKVIVECAMTGTPYEVELNEEVEKWRWFVQLADGTWFPIAGFAETVEDGPDGLVPCS